MKIISNFICILFLGVVLCSGFVSNAQEISEFTQEASVEAVDIMDEEDIMEGAVLIDTYNYMDGERIVIVEKYQLSDGTIVTDTITRNALMMCSANGSDTVSRQREIPTWGTIILDAKFTWKTEGAFSYVKCDWAIASYFLEYTTVVDTWNVSRTENYVSIGKAKAKLEYYFYDSDSPGSYKKGTFTITCTDSGTISDS